MAWELSVYMHQGFGMLIQIENTRLILFLFLNEQSGCAYFILTVF